MPAPGGRRRRPWRRCGRTPSRAPSARASPSVSRRSPSVSSARSSASSGANAAANHLEAALERRNVQPAAAHDSRMISPRRRSSEVRRTPRSVARRPARSRRGIRQRARVLEVAAGQIADRRQAEPDQRVGGGRRVALKVSVQRPRGGRAAEVVAGEREVVEPDREIPGAQERLARRRHQADPQLGAGEGVVGSAAAAASSRGRGRSRRWRRDPAAARSPSRRCARMSPRSARATRSRGRG